MATLARVSTAGLVRWILEHPELVTIVQALDARVLERLVEHVGLENVGEVVALATTEQLERVFDEQLWRSERPGEEETFDARRFGLWLEILLEAGEEIAVEKIAAMDEDMLTLALSKHLFVLDLDAMAAAMSESRSDEHDRVEKALASCSYEEIEEFRVIARDGMRWDAVVTLLVSLDRDHHPLLRRILERCCAATSDHVENNGGLYDVLTSEQMLEADVAGEREGRRERDGFVAPSAAASFLRLARARPLAEIIRSPGHDPVTRAHFRAAPSAVQTPWAARAPRGWHAAPKVEAFLRELREAGVFGEPASAHPALMLEAAAPAGAGEPLVHRAMRALHADAPAVFAERLDELIYLVNVVMAVSRGAEQPPRAIEATEVVTSVCDLGVARLVAEIGTNQTPDDRMLAFVVRKHGLVKAFRVGWHLVGDERWTGEGLRDVGARAARLRSGSTSA